MAPSHDMVPRRTFGSGTRLTIFLGAALVVQSAYLALSQSPNLFYIGNVLAHAFGGLVLSIPLVVLGVRGVRAAQRAGGPAASFGALAVLLFVAAVLAAIALVIVENTRPNRWILNLHIGLASGAVLATVAAMATHARHVAPGGSAKGSLARHAYRTTVGATVTAFALVAIWSLLGSVSRNGDGRIQNPSRPPMEMAGEAMGGADGPFFPSSAETSTGGRVPSNFFMTSKSCKRCHADIYDAWESSAHHFSSFNNQWYRKSIEYMQSVNSVESSKWCAGCHDHAVVFNGMMDDPIAAFIDTQEAHTGLACNSCHAITHVKGTMGNGGFHIEYPPMHDMAVSENAVLRWLHDFTVRMDPGPHRAVFLKTFHREQTAEFCSSCHKVHLDVPVNNYRWFRGFNEYDNWQASGVSGHGARSFYYPASSMSCADCHMQLLPSDDKGNRDGFVHDHSFLAANTALPVANLDETQLRRTIEFLQKNQVTVDIFGVSAARELEEAERKRHKEGAPALATTFAVGEETAAPVGDVVGSPRQLAPLWAPLDEGDIAVTRGRDARVDVVVRTRGVGHFFPGGTVDAHEVWLELRATDETGRTIFWSGVATEGGAGPVDEGAQFYRAQMVDGHGNVITKRNAWATRAVAWVNLIPPGAADVAHFRLSVPRDCGDTITLEARLNYRKFTHVNTHFSFAGQPAQGEPAPGPGVDRVTPHHDDRDFVEGDVPRDISAEVRETPNLPIVVMDVAEATVQVTDEPMTRANGDPEGPRATDALRWNDYGIGLLRQGDLSGARRAFNHTVTANPDYADGHVNLARVAVREGLLDDAHESLRRALELNDDLAAAHYFMGVVLKEEGRYDDALTHLRRAAASYPKDRVVRNTIGRILFLKREYEAAVAELQQVLAIDPEDLAAHYTLLLCYKGLDRPEDAAVEEALYLRFKADEDAPAILGPYLNANPEDNRMRQMIHEQRSVPAGVIAREVSLRDANGEPYTVLPGEAAEFARRVVERGHRLIEEGQGTERYLGPVEADRVMPISLERIRAGRLTSAATSTGTGSD